MYCIFFKNFTLKSVWSGTVTSPNGCTLTLEEIPWKHDFIMWVYYSNSSKIQATMGTWTRNEQYWTSEYIPSTPHN